MQNNIAHLRNSSNQKTHLRKAMIMFIYKKVESPSLRDALFQFGWNWSSGSGEDDFKISLMYFRYFIIISGNGRGPSFEQTFRFC